MMRTTGKPSDGPWRRYSSTTSFSRVRDCVQVKDIRVFQSRPVPEMDSDRRRRFAFLIPGPIILSEPKLIN